MVCIIYTTARDLGFVQVPSFVEAFSGLISDEWG